MFADHGSPIELARARDRLRGDDGERLALASEHYFLNWHDYQPSAPENSAASSATNLF